MNLNVERIHIDWKLSGYIFVHVNGKLCSFCIQKLKYKPTLQILKFDTIWISRNTTK